MTQLHLLKKGGVFLVFAISVANAFADTNGWQNSPNQAQLQVDTLNQSGTAELSYRLENGKLQSFNVADQISEWQASGESYFSLSPRTTVYGSAGFRSTTETGVSGSAFLNNRLHAFDLVLMDAANKGNRKTETYQLQAAIGHQLHRRISIGARFNYEATNRARTRDLRYTNKALCFNISPGMSFELSDRLVTGIHYQYDRYVEGVKFNLYGTTDRQYFTLIDFGAFYGKQELFDSNGYTAKGENTPYTEQNHQLGWQLEYKMNNRFSIFNELMVGSGAGYFGKQASSAIQYTRHDRQQWIERLFGLYREGNRTHRLQLQVSQLSLTNYEKSWRSETSSTGNSVIEYYGENKVGTRNYLDLSARYALEWGTRKNQRWQLALQSDWQQREIQAVLYPYYRKQSLGIFEHRIEGIHQRNIGKMEWQFEGALGYATATGTPYTDGVAITPSTETGIPANADDYLMQEYRYLTASKLRPEIGLRIALPVKKVQYYLNMNYQNTIALGSQEITENRGQLSAALGICF